MVGMPELVGKRLPFSRALRPDHGNCIATLETSNSEPAVRQGALGISEWQRKAAATHEGTGRWRRPKRRSRRGAVKKLGVGKEASQGARCCQGALLMKLITGNGSNEGLRFRP